MWSSGRCILKRDSCSRFMRNRFLSAKTRIGFTNPEFWAYFTGSFEIICGVFILIGLFTRLMSIPLFIIMVTAFVTTKWPLLIEKGFWPFAHEYRTDFAMTLLLIYLLIYGSGRRSVDSKIINNSKT